MSDHGERKVIDLMGALKQSLQHDGSGAEGREVSDPERLPRHGIRFDVAMTRHRLRFHARCGIGVGVLIGTALGAPVGYVVGIGVIVVASAIVAYYAYQNAELAE